MKYEGERRGGGGLQRKRRHRSPSLYNSIVFSPFHSHWGPEGARINLQNFQNLSKTLLCTPNLVIIISALLAITNKIGHIASVSNATKMTGAREVRAEAALGLLERNVWRGFMKPAMFVRDARAHKRETGNI